MDKTEIKEAIKSGNYKLRHLWSAFSDPTQRDEYAIGFGFWDGAGEYRMIELPKSGEFYFIRVSTFDKLRKHCPDCGGQLEDVDAIPPVGVEKLGCRTCNAIYISKYGSPPDYDGDWYDDTNNESDSSMNQWKQAIKTANKEIENAKGNAHDIMKGYFPEGTKFDLGNHRYKVIAHETNEHRYFGLDVKNVKNFSTRPIDLIKEMDNIENVERPNGTD